MLYHWNVCWIDSMPQPIGDDVPTLNTAHLFLGWKSLNSKDKLGTGAVNAFKIYYTWIKISIYHHASFQDHYVRAELPGATSITRTPGNHDATPPVQCWAKRADNFRASPFLLGVQEVHRANSIFSNMKWGGGLWVVWIKKNGIMTQ